MRKQKISKALKRTICIEYMQSGKTRNEICLKYGLPSVNTLSSWVNSYLTPLEIREKCASLPPVESLPPANMENKDIKSVQDQSALIDSMQRQIDKLEKQLKRSEDRNLALNTLIDIAEEQGLKIRKKSGAKQ